MVYDVGCVVKGERCMVCGERCVVQGVGCRVLSGPLLQQAVAPQRQCRRERILGFSVCGCVCGERVSECVWRECECV
jgi:hypothetical protein